MKTIFAILCTFGAAGLFGASSSDKIAEPTMADLKAAFHGESNAHNSYLAFAEQADKEGYAGAASLFRAAARAEQIHASNHAAVIEKFGGVAEAKIEKPAVKTTRENLETAIKGETYERDQMYPRFIQQAKADGVAEAVRTFQFALAAEAEHAKLYTQALQNLESMKAKATYYVCPVCGFTTPKLDGQRCPTCATPKERFERVS